MDIAPFVCFILGERKLNLLFRRAVFACLFFVFDIIKYLLIHY